MSRFVRVGAALTGAAAILTAVAAPAAADPATGKVDAGKNVIGYQVNVGGDWLGTIPTNLLGFTLSDGTTLGMYCVEIATDIDAKHEMVERSWDDYPNSDSPFNKNKAEINWVLHNGFPATKLADLAAKLPTPPNDGLDELEAIAATQAAVWHFSDGVDLNRDDPLSGDGSDAEDAEDALALYDYLTGEANTGVDEAPLPELKIDPAEKKGTVGTKIGPFKVSTNATVEELKADLPDGVKITDADGKEVTAAAIKNGTELFFDVAKGTKDGDGKFELTASATVPTGRLFVGKNYEEKPTQSLIVASAVKTTLNASASGSWSAAPVTETTTSETTTTTTEGGETTTSASPVPQANNDDLAETGASVFTPIVIGLVLIGAGIGAVLFMRRRRA